MKNRAEMPVEKLRLNAVPEKLWQYILVNFIMKLLVSRGYNSVLVVYDRFLKMSYFIMMTEKITAEGLAKLFRDNVWKLHRLLESVISDRGLQFVAELIKELNEMLGDRNEAINGFSSTDRQINKENESRVRTVLENVYRS